MLAQISRNGVVVADLSVTDKVFSTGNTGFYGNGKVVIDGVRYQCQVQLVAIKSAANAPVVTRTVITAVPPAVVKPAAPVTPKMTPAESLAKARAVKESNKAAAIALAAQNVVKTVTPQSAMQQAHVGTVKAEPTMGDVMNLLNQLMTRQQATDALLDSITR